MTTQRVTQAGISKSKAVHVHPHKPCAFVEKIKKVAKKLFEAFCAVVCFPFRYLGSKSWSIPGIILRTPGILFNRIFFKKPITKASFFGAGYHAKEGSQLSQQEAKEVLRYICFGNIPFRYDQDKWAEPFGARIMPPAELGVDLSKLPGKVEATDRAFIDKSNLFKVMVIEDEHEMVVTFGAMHTHWYDVEESEGNKLANQQLLHSVIANYAGLTPRCFDQADAFVAQLKKVAASKNKRLVVTGPPQAAALASYVSLKQEVKGICFNPVQLGAGLQEKIGDAKLANADKYLTQVSVKNDLISQNRWVAPFDRILSGIGVRTPGVFGKRYTIPSAFKSGRKAHDYPTKSMMQYLGYDKEAKANQLKNEDIIKSK